MHLTLKSAMFVIAVTSCIAHAHDPTLSRKWKSESGLVISWEPISTDANSNQVHISDEQGSPVARLNVLRPVPDAERVSIYDVAARGNLVAVAGVYDSKQGKKQVRPTASLLLFNVTGQLLLALALAPSRAVALIAIDDQSNVWTLTDGAGKGVDPSTVPMLVEYTSEGKVAREVLTRDKFPFHATDTREDIDIGAPAMGYDAGILWFWLPASTDFVTVSTRDGQVTITKTQLPKRAGRDVVPLRIIREASGDLVAQVGEDDENGRRIVSHYRWSPVGRVWTQFKPDSCEGQLIGAGANRQIYRSWQPERSETCIFRTSQ